MSLCEEGAAHARLVFPRTVCNVMLTFGVFDADARLFSSAGRDNIQKGTVGGTNVGKDCVYNMQAAHLILFIPSQLVPVENDRKVLLSADLMAYTTSASSKNSRLINGNSLVLVYLHSPASECIVAALLQQSPSSSHAF